MPGTENEVYDVLGGKFFLASPGGNLYNITITAMQLSTNNFFSMGLALRYRIGNPLPTEWLAYPMQDSRVGDYEKNIR